MEFSVYSYVVSLLLLWNQLPFIESSMNLALNKHTTQSTYYGGYPPSNAVDGQNRNCSNFGFSHTNEGPSEWWQVDLGEVCEIKTINVYYRSGFDSLWFLSRLDGYAINITKSLNPLDTWQCYKDTESGDPTNLTPSHECRRLGQYVKFSRDIPGGSAVINLCELEVYGCPQGFYGNGDCNVPCSVDCLHSRCDPDNGNCEKIKCNTSSYLHVDKCVSCPSGCRFNTCNAVTGECLNGCNPSLYGTFCNLTCSTNCYNTSCETNSGDCQNCKTSFYGPKCDKKCIWNCKDKVCKQDDGYCASCHHPYQGIKCTECIEGFYGNSKCTACSEGRAIETCSQTDGHCRCKEPFFGYTCNQSCPANCKNAKCNQTTGHCVEGCKTPSFVGKQCNECVDGNYGENCDKECPSSCYLAKCNRMDGSCSAGCIFQNRIGSRCEACVVGLYGNNCDIACPGNCKHRMCDETDGTCMFGCKYVNMTGNQCDGFLTATTGTDNRTNANIGLIILGIISSINTVFIIIIILILCYKRRRRKETVYENQKVMVSPQTGMDQIDIYNPEQQQTVHYETLGLSDRGRMNNNSADAYTGLYMIEARIHQNDNS